MAFTFDFAVLPTPLQVAGTLVAVPVAWTFSVEAPPRVEIYWRGTGAGGDPLGPFPFATGGAKSGTGTVQIPAGTVVDIGVCPRQVDAANVSTQRTKPRDGEAEHWQNFLRWKHSIGIPATEPPRAALVAPVITGTPISKGRIDVTWRHPGCSFFEVQAGPSGSLPFAAEVDGEQRDFAVRRVTAGVWSISVRACWRNRFFGIPISVSRSAWASVEVPVSAAQGWEPWAGGVPGKAVAVGWQETPGQPVVLTIGGDGRPYVTWPIGFGGWQEPAPIGPPGIVPPGGGIAVLQQAPSVMTAIAIGEDKRLTTWNASDTQAWEGPGAFGPADFPPGGAVALGSQEGGRTVTAAVDQAGAVRIALVEGTGQWRDPAAISPPNFTQPGASVALARLAEDLLALLVVAEDGALNVAWVDGIGAWNPFVPISPARLFDPMSGLGFSAQGMDIGVALVPSRENVPLLSVSQAKGPWSLPDVIGAAAGSPQIAGIGLGRTSFDTLASVWADGDGALQAAGVVTGAAWSAGRVVRPGPFAVPGGSFGMSGGIAAFVDPAGRLAILEVQGAAVRVSGPVLT